MSPFAAEVLFLVCSSIVGLLALWHAVLRRGPRQAALLATMGIGFGYLFPPVVVNGLKLYAFTGELLVGGIPPNLGLAWLGSLYTSLCLAERLVGADASRLRVALSTGVVWGLIYTQTEITLLQSGLLELYLPRFGTYPVDFGPDLTLSIGWIGFMYAHAHRSLRHTTRPGVASLAALLTLVAFPVSLLLGVPLVRPIYAPVSAAVGPSISMVLDVLYFGAIVVGEGLVSAAVFRFLGRKLAPKDA